MMCAMYWYNSKAPTFKSQRRAGLLCFSGAYVGSRRALNTESAASFLDELEDFAISFVFNHHDYRAFLRVSHLAKRDAFCVIQTALHYTTVERIH